MQISPWIPYVQWLYGFRYLGKGKYTSIAPHVIATFVLTAFKRRVVSVKLHLRDGWTDRQFVGQSLR